jgi:hypothetical protein
MRVPEETESAQVRRPPDGTTSRIATQVMGARFLISARLAAAFSLCQMALGVIPAPQILPSRLTRRKTAPLCIPAAVIHSSKTRFVHVGMGTERMCLPLPIKSAITQCASRTGKSSVPSPTSSARRSPHPMSSARIARSRLPLRLSDGAPSRVLDGSTVN